MQVLSGGNLSPRNDLARRAKRPNYKEGLNWLEAETLETERLL